jgi:adenylate cyclase
MQGVDAARQVPVARGKVMGRDKAPYTRRFGWTTAASAKLVALAARVGVDPSESGETALQRLVMVLLAVGTLPMTILWSVVYLAAGAPLAAAAPAVYSVATPINTALFAWTRNLRLYRFIQLLMTLVLPWMVTTSLGGFKNSSAVIIWAALCPLVSLLVEDLRQTVLWIVGFVLLLIVSATLEPSLKVPELPQAFVTWFFVLNLGSVIAIVFALLYYFIAQRNFFQERSETLLLNILPKEISDALKTDQGAIAAHYESASVLFADVVGFTSMAAAMVPLRLVNLLNEVFSSFDDLVEKHGLEKIKTIGDSYMVASGVPRERADHALALVQLALDMRDAVANRTFGGETLAFRIGVNSGPVVAGVIGRKKFIYDLWGATVNLASRMESHGQSGAIQITRSTYDLVSARFDCESARTIRVKGAGGVEVWRVVGGKRGSQAEVTSS